jgi:hypothetical protein
VEGADSGGGGALEIGLERVAAVGGLAGGAIEAVEGESEDRGVGFAGAGLGGGDDDFEAGTDPECVEEGAEAVVEVRDDGEGAERGGGFEECDGFGVETPGSRRGVMVKEVFEIGVEIGRAGEVGRRGPESKQKIRDEAAPPCPFRRVAVEVQGVRGRGGGCKRAAERRLQEVGIETEAEGGEMAGVDGPRPVRRGGGGCRRRRGGVARGG